MDKKQKAITDTDRLDFLQRLTDRAAYSGRVMLRESSTGRGWRLHETSRPGADKDVRSAIDRIMNTYDEQDEAKEKDRLVRGIL